MPRPPPRRVDLLGAHPANIGRRGPDAIGIRDSFSGGPLPPIRSFRAWEALRTAYWRRGDERRGHMPRPYGDPVRWPWASEIVVWLGTGLEEQILLAWVVAILRHFDRDPAALRVVQLERNGRGVEIGTVRMLTPRFGDFPDPIPLSPAAVAELDVAWAALTAPDPGPLLSFIRDPTTALPYLKRALAHVPARYPDPTSGLGIYDMRLLRYAREWGPRALDALIGAMVEGDRTPDRVGDGWLVSRLRRLAAPTLPSPPLTLTGRDFRRTQVHVTPFGHAILDGRANFIHANGIDDWVCGVHFHAPPSP